MCPLCNPCPSCQNDTCLHLRSCCKNKHINNLLTNRHNEVAHALANIILTHPKTCYFTLKNASITPNRIPNNTIPSWLLLCTWYLPKYKCPSRLWPNTFCVLRSPTQSQTPLAQSTPKIPNLWHTAMTVSTWKPPTKKLNKYALLQPLLTQLGWVGKYFAYNHHNMNLRHHLYPLHQEP